jgi:hypothetical protein
VRFESLFSTTQSVDNQGHITASTNGLNDVIDHPTGFGLGANPATGVRNHTTNATNTENSYLGVGTELGDAAMFCFIGLYLALLVELRRRSHEPGEAAKLAGASWLAGCGLLVGGLFLPIWPDFPVALTYWGLAGFATMKPAIDAEPYDALESPDQADLLTKISR